LWYNKYRKRERETLNRKETRKMFGIIIEVIGLAIVGSAILALGLMFVCANSQR
jgi:hypothetical protein